MAFGKSQKSAPVNKWERSEDYRKGFVKRDKGLFGKLYFCAYCGKPITHKGMQVDHIIAVNRINKNPLYKPVCGIFNLSNNLLNLLTGQFKKSSNKGVNVEWNFVPACKKCNRRKSDKGGFWVMRGMIGGLLYNVGLLVRLVLKLFFKYLAVPAVVIGGIYCGVMGVNPLDFIPNLPMI